MKPTKIEIMPFGFSVSFKLYTRDYNKKILKANLLELKKIIVAVSGPVANLIIILALLFLNIDFARKTTIIYANFLIMTFNLIPIYPLDGGRILKSVIHIFCGGKSAKIFTNKTANITMITLSFVGSIGVFYFENIAIFLVLLFLWWLVICENKKYKLLITAYEKLKRSEVHG